MYGHTAYCAEVTCPDCKEPRWYPCGTLRQQLKRENFTGRCSVCSLASSRAGHTRVLREAGRTFRWVSPAGYVIIGASAIADEDLPLYRQMVGTLVNLMEHRWVMAKHLGRPLSSWECVDHMDGEKTNNTLDNLRIYVRGKQQPGSCPGYGTYYHEWQMAEKRLRDLSHQPVGK